MIEIKIDTFTNGYSLSVFDKTDGYIVREIAETKTEILATLLRIITNMAQGEQARLRGTM